MQLLLSEHQRLPRKKRLQKRAPSRLLQIVSQKIQIHVTDVIAAAVVADVVVASHNLMARIQKAQRMSQKTNLAIPKTDRQRALHIAAADVVAQRVKM
jgi:hypothetical protein